MWRPARRSLRVVSAKFEGLGAVARHRLVYALLDEEMRGGVHALAITALTPDEAAAAPQQ